MGAVYKARQPTLDRLVALKVLPARPGAVADFAERFGREARALAKLNHPNIVAVYEFGQVEGLHYFVMEYVDGTTLRQMERAGRLSPREALAIVPAICDALQYAHDEGVVHRDIKPENVLIDRRGRVKIADFGLARMLDLESGAVRLTGEGQVMGTPHYMAPEQIEHPLEVDHRADIFALGVVFYEMLTGELPLGRFPPPSSRMRGVRVDVRLDEVVLRALEKEPERRYQHASEVRTAVETIAQAPEAATASSVGSPAPPPRRGVRLALVGVRDGRKVLHWPGVLLVAVLLAVAAVVAVSVFGAYLLGVSPGAVKLSLSGPLALVTILVAVPLLVGWLWRWPADKLPCLDRPKVGATPAPEVTEELLRQVRRPAVGLFAVGVANWVVIPLVAAPLLYLSALRQGESGPRPALMLALLLSAFVLSGIVFVGSLRMMRLQSYGLAVAAAILAMVVTPGNLIGFPIGIWALVVLLRPEVRAAFDTGQPLPPVTGAPPARGGNGSKTAMVVATAILAGLVLLGVLFLGLLLTWRLLARSRAATETSGQLAQAGHHRRAARQQSGDPWPPAGLHNVCVEGDRAVINGQGPADHSVVLQIGAPGTAATWAARLGQDPPNTEYTAFDGTVTLTAEDGPRLQFVVTRRGGSVAQYIDLASVPGLPRGRVLFRTLFRTVAPSAEADGSYVVADLVPESGPALPISVSLRPTREVGVRNAVTAVQCVDGKATIAYSADADHELFVFVGNGFPGWAARRGVTHTGQATVEASDQIRMEDGSKGRGFVFVAGGVRAFVAIAPGGSVPLGTLVLRQDADITEANGTFTFADIRQEDGTRVPVCVRVRPATAGFSFGPVIEKVISTADADGRGLVFFDLETGETARPPFPLALRPGKGPAFVDLTLELTEWIRAQDMDLLLHLGDKGWDMMTLDMQQDFAGQLDEWETVSTAAVVALFARQDAAGQVRDAVPAASFGHGYRDGFGAFDAFRTRNNTMGVYQFEGVANSTRRGVSLRYKLVRIPALATPGGASSVPVGSMPGMAVAAPSAGGTLPGETPGMSSGLASPEVPGALKPGRTSKPGIFAPGAPASVLVVRREVNRNVADFPEAVDLSTPESACAAFHRAGARLDVKAWSQLGWVPFDVTATEARLHEETAKDPQAMAVYLKAVGDATIIEVLNWGADLAETVTYLPLPTGMDTRPYSARTFGRINGQWKNLGEDRLPTQEAARASFEAKKEALWQQYQDLAEKTAAVTAPPAPPAGLDAIRHSVGTFISAGLAGDRKALADVCLPEVAEQALDGFGEIKGLQGVQLAEAHVAEQAALAVTTPVAGDHQRIEHLVFELTREADGVWRIADVDIEDAPGAADEVQRFRTRHPAAKVVLVGAESAPEVKQAAEK
jgi:hypothetical protein